MEKYIYQVIIKNDDNEIMVCHLFENMENAMICFKEFHTRYSTVTISGTSKKSKKVAQK